MNTKNLHYVLTIAEEKSFSKAARKLYIAQPSLSQSINLIEEDIGVKLFDRSSVPLKLTYAGERFVEASRQILDIEKNLLQELNDISCNSRGRITLGIASIWGQWVLPAVLSEFKSEFPNIELQLIEDTSGKLIEYALGGKADIVVSSRSENQAHKGLKYIKVFEDDILLAAPSGHVIVKKADIGNGEIPVLNLMEIKDEPFILLNSGQGLRKAFETIFEMYGFRPRVLMETKNIETALKLTAAGMGFTLIIHSKVNLLEPANKVACFQFDKGPVKYPMYICYREKMYLSKAHLCLINLIQKGISENPAVS